MTWQDPRPAGRLATTVVRRAAHSDDAKHRTDESTRTQPRGRRAYPRRLPRWALPAGAGALVVAVVGGVALAATGGHDPQPASGSPASTTPGAASTSTDAATASPSAPAPDPALGTHTVRGTQTFHQFPYHGMEERRSKTSQTIELTCSPTRCTVGQFPRAFRAAGPGTYVLPGHAATGCDDRKWAASWTMTWDGRSLRVEGSSPGYFFQPDSSHTCVYAKFTSVFTGQVPR